MSNLPSMIVRRVDELCSSHFPCSFLTEKNNVDGPRALSETHTGSDLVNWLYNIVNWLFSTILASILPAMGLSKDIPRWLSHVWCLPFCLYKCMTEAYLNSWRIVSCCYTRRNSWWGFSIKADKESILKQWAHHFNSVVLYCVYCCSIQADPPTERLFSIIFFHIA